MLGLTELIPIEIDPENRMGASLSRQVDNTMTSWNRAVRDTLASGDVEALHSSRDDYARYLRGLRTVVDGYRLLTQPRSSDLHVDWNELSKRLQDHEQSLFPRWDSLESLETMLLETIAPSKTSMTEAVKRCAPVETWAWTWSEEPSGQPS